MRLIIDTSGVSFTVGREAQPRTDQNGVQRVERNSNVPMWSVQLVAVDEGGAEVLNVTVVAVRPPEVAVGTVVTPVDLQAIPWAQNGKNGVAFRASEIRAVTTGSGAKSNTSAAS